MKSPKKLMAFSVMALALVLPACSESGMRADQEEAQVPAGTQLYVRVNQNMPSGDQGWKSGDEFQGTLARALEVNGRVIAPEGTIVKGELTSNLGVAGAAGRMGEAVTGESATGDTAGRDNTDTSGARSGADTRADRDVTGDPTMSAGQMDRDRLGMELKKIVLNGEEYDIDTQAVAVPGMAGHAGSTAPGQPGTRSGGQEADEESMAKAQIAGQEFVFTLEDNVDLPSTTNMTTE